MSGRKVVKQACDGCKIRKIRCSGLMPCEGCQATGIACTFVKQPATRGPRSLRKSTLREIAQTQQQWERMAEPRSTHYNVHREQETDSGSHPAKIAALVLQLCVYRLRVYPIWPIIKMERLVASLQIPDLDFEVLALAYAVAAATIARIVPKSTEQPGGVTAVAMEEQCQIAKQRRRHSQPPDLTTVRIPLFLHFYYESLEPGGLQSITYLREAIAVAHMIGLHRESYYENVQPEEQEIRRRTLWLLFVSERGVSISHKLPVIIRTRIAFPNLNDTDEPDVLLAYQKLISMFWYFDQAGVFELLDSQDFDLGKVQYQPNAQNEAFESVRRRLDDSTNQTLPTNSVQSLDIIVTRLWMKIILWRLAESHGFFTHGFQNISDQLDEPVQIARELLVAVSSADKATIEAHGTSLETKIFEVASTVADVIALGSAMSVTPDLGKLRPAQEVLLQMYNLLIGNQTLANMLSIKMKQLQSSLDLSFSPDVLPQLQDENTALAWDIDRQLQEHGFHFTETFASEPHSGGFHASGESQHALNEASVSPQPTHHSNEELFWRNIPEMPMETPSSQPRCDFFQQADWNSIPQATESPSVIGISDMNVDINSPELD